uniref:Myb-like domain-containing protein n=1 Tax=Arundo donax TaxID=35708 RepID=A0A0A8Z2D1_ARUDO
MASYTQLMSEDIDLEELSLPLTPPELAAPSNGVKGSTRRAGNYTHEEDIQLYISQEAISTDPIISNEQPGKAYWKQIADHFHVNRVFESDRNANSLEHRWSTLAKECSKFQGYYDRVERRHPSGILYKEHILEARALYALKDPKKKKFLFIHCWLKVRNCPKFQGLESHKRVRPSKSSMPSDAPTAIEENGDDSNKSATPDSSQPSSKKRPPGRKQSNDKMKNGGDSSEYKEAIQELVAVKEKEGKLKEERWRETKEIQ